MDSLVYSIDSITNNTLSRITLFFTKAIWVGKMHDDRKGWSLFARHFAVILYVVLSIEIGLRFLSKVWEPPFDMRKVSPYLINSSSVPRLKDFVNRS